VIGVGFDVTDRQAAEAGMRDREARLAAVFNHASDAMTLYAVHADGTLRLVAANRASLERFRRVKEAEVLGLTFSEIALDFYQRSPEAFAHYQTLLRSVIDTRTALTFEDEAATRDGMIFVEATIVPILDDTGRCAQVLWSSRDVTVERKAAERTRASLAEKETLLREIHHRVKNNLQVISGLLHFQGKKLTAPADVAAFAELRQRIFAMTLLHERLYQSPDVGSVAFGDYVQALVAELGRSSAPGQGIHIGDSADDVRLPLELAMPAGMIISELVTNVLKYAFPGVRRGTATVSVQRAGDHVVVGVDDDGVGFPHGFTSDDGTSFGWELVRMLVLQINGTVEATTDRGAHVRVAFQLPSEGRRS
jgi:two-component sensor histidine kinase